MKITNQAEYDAAKIELKLKEENSIAQCCINVTADMIRADLLKYRRANNIFEVGDFVVNDAFIDSYVYVFKELLTGISMALIAYDEDEGACGLHGLRHATDAEIEANRRLDLPETVAQSLGEVS